MLSAPSRLSNTTVVRDRRPRRSSHNNSSSIEEAVGGDLPSHPRGGGAPRTSPGVPPHPPRPRGGAVVPGFPRPPPPSQVHVGGVAPPIVRSHPPRLPVSFELQSLTTKSRARSSDPTTDTDSPVEAPDVPALQARNTRNAWATTTTTTTTVTATVITRAEPNEQVSETSATAEQTRDLPSQRGPQEPAEERPDTPPPLPLTPSDTNLPPIPPSPPPDPQPTIPKSLRPQRPQRTRRGCSGAAGENRNDESIAVAASNHPVDTVVSAIAPPAASANESSHSSPAKDETDEGETPSVSMSELEDASLCRRPTSPLSAAVPARVEASFRARARTRPRTLPLAIFSCDDGDDAAAGSSLQVNIVPARDDVPLTLRDYAALVGHVLMASEGPPSDDESSAQKAECILGAAVTRREDTLAGPDMQRPGNPDAGVDFAAAAARDAD